MHYNALCIHYYLGNFHSEDQRQRERGYDEDDGAEGEEEGTEAHAVLTEGYKVNISPLRYDYFFSFF